MAWGLWVMCPRSWEKLWLNYCCFTCRRVDGVQACTARRPRVFVANTDRPSIHQIQNACEASTTYLRLAAAVRGREGSGLSAERQSAPCRPRPRPAEHLGARAKPFAHPCNNRRRAAGGAPGLPHWGQPLSNHHGQRRVLRREKTVQSRFKR